MIRLLSWAPSASAVRALALLFILFSSLPTAEADEWHFSGVDRIVAISDIHGAYGAMVETLQAADVIDDELAWVGGKTHLVITGDLLDRGADSRRVMDLVIRLEHESRRSGGRVHQLLGNHEVMNLIGDLRYVADEEYAAFLDIESAEEREFWYQRFRSTRPADIDESRLRTEFDAKAPPGYFGHRRAFRKDGVYGKWLLKKPIMVVINDTAFVHGGIPPFVVDHGLAGVNDDLKKDLIDFVTTSAELIDNGVLSPIDEFKRIPAMLIDRMETGQLEGKFMTPAQQLVGLSTSPLYTATGPTWYRGTATCNSLVEGDATNAALSAIDAKRVVIGHTSTITRRVQQRMNGRIVEIDTGMLKEHYEGSGHALVIDDGELSVVNQDGSSDLLPITHPLHVGPEAMPIDDDAMASILLNGTVVDIDTDGATWKLVKVTSGGTTVSAHFTELPRKNGFVPELAAYKLDRMLNLGMVPVTVRREIGGEQGTLQYVPEVILTDVIGGNEDSIS